MISKSDMDAYARALGNIASAAERAAASAVAAVAAHVGLSVAEVREGAKAVLEPVATAYGEAASELAAEFYAMTTAADLPPAEVAPEPVAESVDSAVRYQIRKLMDGDSDGFARACGAFARDSARRSAASTMLGAAERDRARGVRFARVPSGTETCTFCRMLASRGFVYWSRETAGAFDHFHRGCDCRVVASDDPEGVEGYDPDRELILWKRFEEIDADNSLSKVERDSAKRAALEAAAPHRPTLGGAMRGKPMSFEEADSCHVNPKYGSEPGYSVNCQSCVVTFEARLRGYDVYTKANVKGSMLERLSYRTNLAWIDPETGKHPAYISSDANTPKRYVRFLNQAIGRDGERYTIQFAWKGKNKGGHIVNLDRTESGELRLKDNQRGPHEKSEWIGDREISRYLSEVKFEMVRNKRKVNVGPRLLRVDNMEFDESVVNQIMAAVK